MLANLIFIIIKKQSNCFSLATVAVSPKPERPHPPKLVYMY